MTVDVAIIGDRFMRSEVFIEALQSTCGDAVSGRGLDFDWPDVPLVHGYVEPGFEGLKEYFGDSGTVLAHLDQAPVLVTHLAPLSRTMLAALPALKLVVVARGGPVNIDRAAAAEHGLRVANVPGRNASAVAEFTIGAILAETRNITRGHDALRQGTWRGELYRADIAGEELSDMTVGVIGYGNVGRSVVRLLRAFGARVLVCDPYRRLDPGDTDAGVTMTDLPGLLSASDVVTLHANVTIETRGMIGAGALAAMKPGSVLVNTARGPLVDYNALHAALVNGHLRGAFLETFAVEPVPAGLPLLSLPNVTLTPHIAGASQRTVRIAAASAAEEVRRWLAGEPPLNPC